MSVELNNALKCMSATVSRRSKCIGKFEEKLHCCHLNLKYHSILAIREGGMVRNTTLTLSTTGITLFPGAASPGIFSPRRISPRVPIYLLLLLQRGETTPGEAGRFISRTPKRRQKAQLKKFQSVGGGGG